MIHTYGVHTYIHYSYICTTYNRLLRANGLNILMYAHMHIHTYIYIPPYIHIHTYGHTLHKLGAGM